MILPIVAYGDPVLRKMGKDIDEDHKGLQKLIDNMYETMYNAPGVGLAAPQIGKAIRLFVVDTEQLFKVEEGEEPEEHEYPEEDGIIQEFINAKMLKEYGKPWQYEEGCLSIPGIREKVSRKDTIVIQYYDRDFNLHEEEFGGITARVIQHEYDHIEGTLFTDKINPIKKRLIKRKLDNISKGKVEVAYKMLFPQVKKRR